MRDCYLYGKKMFKRRCETPDSNGFPKNPQQDIIKRKEKLKFHFVRSTWYLKRFV